MPESLRGRCVDIGVWKIDCTGYHDDYSPYLSKFSSKAWVKA